MNDLLDVLIAQRAWIRHWQDDIRAGLMPTEDSLRDAHEEIVAAIAKLKGEST